MGKTKKQKEELDKKRKIKQKELEEKRQRFGVPRGQSKIGGKFFNPTTGMPESKETQEERIRRRTSKPKEVKPKEAEKEKEIKRERILDLLRKEFGIEEKDLVGKLPEDFKPPEVQNAEEMQARELGRVPFEELPVAQQIAAETAVTGLPGVGLRAIGTGKNIVGEAAEKVVELSKKQAKQIAEAQAIRRSARTFRITTNQAEKIFKKRGFFTGRELAGKAKSLAKIGTVAFFTTFGAQGIVYWGSVDNLAASASMDSKVLLDSVTFNRLNRDKYERRKEEILEKLEDAKWGTQFASRLNPVTAWAFGKFYKNIIEGSERTVLFNLAEAEKKLLALETFK